MSTKKTKPVAKKTVGRAEKIIKVKSSTHHKIKIKAAEQGKSIGEYLDEKVDE